MNRTYDLLNLRSSGNPGFARLFSRAHSHAWDIDRDVDWTQGLHTDDELVAAGWAPYSRTEAYARLSAQERAHFNRRALSWTLNSLRLGESVALEVCLKIAQGTRLDDYRNHAAAQAMDEARHHQVYVRLIEMMGEPPDEVDRATRNMFDEVLSLDELVDLVAWEQFYLESVAVNVLRGVRDHATHPLIKKVFSLNLRDEARHLGFGVLFIQEHFKTLNLEDRIAFARRWLNQILTLSFGGQDPVAIQRLTRWLYESGVADSVQTAMNMLNQQGVVLQQELEAVFRGERIPQELKSAQQAGLLAPEILEALGLQNHPVILGTLRSADPVFE
ncbi:MAG: ferritin-like domain-containing protein [Myxococcota bacterium]